MWAAGAVVFAIGLAARSLFGVPLATLTRDPIATLDGVFYIGAISDLGVQAWGAAAVICFFAHRMLAGDARHAATRGFLMAFGLLSVMLLVDDLFLVHEDIMYGYLHVPEVVTFGTYALLGLLATFVYRRVIARTDVALFVMAIAVFAFSVAADLFPETPARHLIEDGSKLVGIFAWLAWLARAAAGFLREAGMGAK